MKLKHITLGTDPEMFLYNTVTNQFVSAVGLIPGTKEEPFIVKDKQLKTEGFALQTDNVLIEFNVPPVNLRNKHQFLANIVKMQYFIRKYVKAINPNYDIKCQASAIFPNNELTSAQANLFGCDPDYNAYTLSENSSNSRPQSNLRSAGFHLHIGYQQPTLQSSVNLIRYLDAYVGLPSILLDPDTERRKLYGKAGAFRIQPWGVEWRTLSSYFIKDTTMLSYIYDLVRVAITAFEYEIPLPDANKVVDAINNSDAKLAREIIKSLEIKQLQ